MLSININTLKKPGTPNETNNFFIQHAADKLKERWIPIDLVKETIKNPDKINFENERKIAQKLVDGMLLRVITKKRIL